MVVGVVIVLEHVVLDIDVVLIDILAHVHVGEHILQLGVVVEGNGREWVKVVGVDSLCLRHAIILSLLRGCLLAGLVRLVGSEVKSEIGGVDQEVGAPSHAAHCTHSI